MKWLLWAAAAASLAAQPLPPACEELEELAAQQRRLLADYGGLVRYGSENAELRPAAGRVVFFGDDITENWPEAFFAGKPYLNRGIARQNTAQMLVRFRQDVIALKPAVVVIQAGANDIAAITGPITERMSAENFMTMVELAQAHGIRVVLASLTPVCDCTRNQTARRPVGRMLGLNAWLKEYAGTSGAVYLDLYAALVEGRALKAEYSDDGFLLSPAAYEKLAPLAEKAIAAALAKPGGAR